MALRPAPRKHHHRAQAHEKVGSDLDDPAPQRDFCFAEVYSAQVAEAFHRRTRASVRDAPPDRHRC